jgi:hypothetical protein
MPIVNTTGLDMPADFPTDRYNAIDHAITPHREKYPDVWPQYAAAWSGVTHRYFSAAAADDRFRVSIKQQPGPPPPERQPQEEDLFLFFVAGLAAIESFTYATYAVGAMLDSTAFPFSTPDDRRKVTPKTTSERLSKRFGGTSIAARFAGLLKDKEFKTWSDIRNEQAHRLVAPRHHHLGGADEPYVVWGATHELPMNDKTTAYFRSWLGVTFGQMAADLDDFVRVNFP